MAEIAFLSYKSWAEVVGQKY